MSENQGYRQRVAEIRQQAREHINNLRIQRLAKRKTSLTSNFSKEEATPQTFDPNGNTQHKPEPQPADNHDNETAEQISTPDNFAKSYPKSFSQNITPKSVENVIGNEHNIQSASDASTMGAGTEEKTEIREKTQTDEDTTRPVATTALTDTAPHPSHTQNQSDTNNENGIHHEYSAKSSGSLLKDFITELEQLPFETTGLSAQSSIVHVPTLGEGMVWRLRQLGIETLGDLAVEKPDSLTSRLGTIGTLVRADLWIEFARNTCETSTAGN